MTGNTLKGKLPSLTDVLKCSPVPELLKTVDRELALSVFRSIIDRARESFLSGGRSEPLTVKECAETGAEEISRFYETGMKRVINCTGTVLHTGLGRAPLPEKTVTQLADTIGGYCFLQTDQTDLKRCVRERFIIEVFRLLTGCETAVVVNNNAAAIFFYLQHIAAGKEVIISRSELVEIGGSFRIPDVMNYAKVKLVEVGTTNKARIEDYEKAITENTAAILRVHKSNYRIKGFTEYPATGELVSLAHKHDIFMIYDLGSGTMVNLNGELKDDEPLVKESIDSGVDLVSFSTDKVLGGPQAGVILGKSEVLEPMRKDPFFRVLRPCKMTLIALESTMRLYLQNPEQITRDIPVLEMFTRDISRIESACREVEKHINSIPGFQARIADDVSTSGGGAYPAIEIPTKVVEISAEGFSAGSLSDALRTVPGVPVLGRIRDNKLVLDMRTLLYSDIETLKAAFHSLSGNE